MAHAYSTQHQLDLEAGQARAAASLKAAHSWVEQIEGQPGTVKAMDAEMLLEENHPFLEDVSARQAHGCGLPRPGAVARMSCSSWVAAVVTPPVCTPPWPAGPHVLCFCVQRHRR